MFTVRKLIAEWGTLTVDGGALLEDRTISKGRLSLRNAAADHLSGDGWALQLNEGCTVASRERKGDRVISKELHR